MKTCRVPAWLISFLALGSTAWSADWYVDVANGADTRTGTSPAEAWRTITHALATVPAAPPGATQVIHVAPGTYSAASGESFPIGPRDAFQIVSDAGSRATILDAGGAPSVIAIISSSVGYPPGPTTGPLTRVEGFRLLRATYGVLLSTSAGSLHLTGVDLAIEGMTGAGVRVAGSASLTEGNGASATLERVEILGCATGASLSMSGSGYLHVSSLSLRDCRIQGSLGNGIVVSDSGNDCGLGCTRTEIVDSAGVAVSIAANYPSSSSAAMHVQASFDDCLLARNGGGGVQATSNVGVGSWEYLRMSFARTTIARNLGVGIDAYYPAGGTVVYATTVADSIVYGNVDDVRENPARPAFTSVTGSDIGDGDFAGGSGNIAADPAFLDAAGGDFRLRWGSPCVDTATAGAGAGTPDVRGTLRPVDGDLDALERGDMGALEFTPLDIEGAVHVGSPFALELWGPSGGRANLFMARGPLLAVPIATPFGELDLDPAGLRNLGSTAVGAATPFVRVLAVPDDAAWIGRTISVQALATSSVSVPAGAWTNARSLTILP